MQKKCSHKLESQPINIEIFNILHLYDWYISLSKTRVLFLHSNLFEVMKNKKCIFKFIFFTSSILVSSCTKKYPKTTEQKISFYESQARTYQALADAQRLSPPYNSSTFRNRGGLYDPSMRMVYLSEAKKYKKLAEQAKKQFNSE